MLFSVILRGFSKVSFEGTGEILGVVISDTGSNLILMDGGIRQQPARVFHSDFLEIGTESHPGFSAKES